MNNQFTESVKDQKEATYDIDCEPFVAAIQCAMQELGSSKTLRTLRFEDHDYGDNTYVEYDEVAVVGMGLIFHLTGEEEPCLTNQEIHEFGRHPELLKDYLFQDASGLYGSAIRADPSWLFIVDRVTKAYVSAYNGMFFQVEV